MAIMTPGPTVGQVSGRIGGIVYSHNRGGAYIRNGAMPTTSTTPYAQAAKARLAYFSALWAVGSAANQQAWKLWATQNPITNRLGAQITLSGHAAFVKLNIRADLGGGSVISLPPIVPPPAGITLGATVFNLTGNVITYAYTPTPIGANYCVMTEAAVSDNPGVAYVRNLYKLVQVSAANAASPVDYEASLGTRFGTLQVGQRVFVNSRVLDITTGLVSGPVYFDGTLV